MRILVEPKNALTKQYEKLFELEDVGLTFDEEALARGRQKALKRGTGARGLRAILETMMTDIMFDLPTREDVRGDRHHQGSDHGGHPAARRDRAGADEAGGVTRRREGGTAEALDPPPFAFRRPLPMPVEFVGSFPDPLVTPRARRCPRSPSSAGPTSGKSSLLNALVGRPGLARVSGTPGKTTLLNVVPAAGAATWWTCRATASPARARARGPGTGAWSRRYLTQAPEPRRASCGCSTSRHPPSKDDLEIQDLLVESGRPVLAVLTKADKLTRSAQSARARELAAALGLQEDQVQLTSIRSGLGIGELAQSIIAATGGGR